MLRAVVDRDAVRRSISGHRSAERRGFELMKQEGPMASEHAFEAAMELCDLAVVPEHDPVRDREIAEARAVWTKLKKPWVAKHA
jgi:hypothetical protein